MADVRLTAVNPEDSQVYPVACNDKGELLLQSTNGDFDVPGNLTVAGTAEFAKSIASETFDQNSATGSGYQLYVDSTLGQITAQAPSTTAGISALIRTYHGGDNTSSISADGSATFAGDVKASLFDLSNNTTAKGARIGQFGVTVQRAVTGGSSVDTVFTGFRGSTQTSSISADGSASFAENVTANLFDAYRPTTTAAAELAVFHSDIGGTKTRKIGFLADGSASFTGNVTAPNINFKLAPATVAAMPAPLIDEGFVANDEIDLLSVLMEMKLQIRDLNAFMQRSTQDNPET